MRQNSMEGGISEISICLPIPAPDPTLYGSGAIDDVLLFLARHRFEQFTQRELAEHIEYSEATVRRGVQTLAENDLIEYEYSGNQKLVEINRDRLSVPDDPFLQIPQEKFQKPVKTAVEALEEGLTDVVGVILYGSVARGEADRRSDIDLWIVVEDERAANQRMANTIEKDLEEQEFDGERFEFHIAVESVNSIPAFTEDISRIVRSGIPVYKTDKFDTLQSLLIHHKYNE